MDVAFSSLARKSANNAVSYLKVNLSLQNLHALGDDVVVVVP